MSTKFDIVPINLSEVLTGLFRKNNVFNYAVSVPWRKVRQNEEVILAWEMNGEPLPKIHGAPLRVVVTGYIGARSCKWVYKINALAEPSLGPVQAQEYLYFTPQVRISNYKLGKYQAQTLSLVSFLDWQAKCEVL